MDNILFLECSPHGDASLGTQLAQELIGRLRSAYPRARVVSRSLGLSPLPPVSGSYAKAITGSRAHGDPAFACSEKLITELECSDFVLISTPMHNFTVPAALKLWIDHVLRIGRTFRSTPEGKLGLLQDRPALVLVRSGSPCTGASARQPDFLTPYLRHALAVIGIRSSDFLYLEGLTPNADELADVRQKLAESPSLCALLGEPS